MSAPAPRPTTASAADETYRVTPGYALLAAASAILFSAKAVLVKLAYAHGSIAHPVDPITLLTLRMVFALPFFAAVGWWSIAREGALPLTRRDHGLIIMLGLLGYYFSSYMDFIALQYISAALERLILYLYPTLVLLISVLFLRHRVTRRHVVALAISYAGILLVFGHDLHVATDQKSMVLGVGFVLLSSVSYAVYLVVGAEVIKRAGPTRFTAYVLTVSCIACVAHFLVVNPLSALDLPVAIYGYSATIAVLSTVAPSFMIAMAIKRIGVNNVSVIGAAGPLATIALGALLLGERINAWQLAGALLVIVGVLTITIKPRAS